MSARRFLAALALFALALPAFAQKQGIEMQPMTLRPEVELTSPADADHFVAGQTVVLSAVGYPMTGEIVEMDIYLDGTLYASAMDTADIAVNWTATVGTHTVAAKATDQALSRTSPTITITVAANTLPSVSLTAPATGTVYAIGASVPMTATASDSDGTIARVEFWVDGVKKGQDTSSPYAYSWPATAGSHTLMAKAVDNVNGTASSSTVTIRGNVPPTASLTAPANSATYTIGDTVTMNAAASDSDGTVTKVQFWVDGALLSSDTTSPFSRTWTATAGSHTLKVRAYDNDGGISGFSDEVAITGNALPAVNLTAPATGTVYAIGASVPMTATASDSDGTIARVEFWVDGVKKGQDTSSPYAYSWPATAGSHTLMAKAVDNANATASSSTVTIRGNVPPTASLTAPANGATFTVGDTVTMNAAASDSDGTVTKVQFWVDGALLSSDTTSPFSRTWTATAGAHTLKVRAYDNDGGISVFSDEVAVTGNTPPTVNLTAPATGATYTVGDVVALTASAADSDGTVTKVEFYRGSTLLATDTSSPYGTSWTAVAGSSSFTAKAYDDDGASTTSSVVTVTVNSPNNPPTVSLTADASTDTAGTPVNLTATASDTDGSVTKVEFYRGSTLLFTDTSSPYGTSWTAVAGSSSFTAKAYDDDGASTTSSVVTVTVNSPNNPPTVSLTADASTYTAGTPVNLTATASDTDGSVTKVEFYRGSTLLFTDTSSPYGTSWTAVAGSSSFTAKAYDDDGASTTSSVVTVTVNSPNNPPTVSLTADASTYTAGTPVNLTATASDTDGSVTKVEFYRGSTLLFTDTSSPYGTSWTAVAGSSSFTAKAYDDDGASTTSSVVTVTVNSPNNPPTVSLTGPSNGASYLGGANVTLSATASDTDGTIARVDFYVDGGLLGSDTSSSYSQTWVAAPGSHVLEAIAVDDQGAGSSPSQVTVSVEIPPPTRKYAYNSYQELCRVEEPETGATLMGYDAAGNLTWSASGLSATDYPDCSAGSGVPRKVTRTYDARNRISTLVFPDYNGNQEWHYTPDGLPASVTTYNDGGASSVVNTYAYNKRRLLAQEQQQAGAVTRTVGYGYDANGNLSTLTYPADGLVVDYAPNALGQPTKAGSYATNVTYYPNGAIAGFTYGNGIVHTLTQNLRGLPDRSQDMNGATPVHDDGYDYDDVGNVVGISDGVAGARGNRYMEYDGLNRLVLATGSPTAPSLVFGTATYTYDAYDNLKHVHVTGGPQARDQEYVYDQSNRLTNVMEGTNSVIGLGYDVQGNLANKNGVLYGFDYGNRLRTAGPESYRYDVQGRRIRSSSSAGTIDSLYSQSGQLLFQDDGRSGKRRQYVYLGGSLVAESAVPQAGGTPVVTYQHTDALGTPVAITNSAKTVIVRREYEPYGYQTSPTLQDGPNYTGHVADAATGLVYMQQRYYDPLVGGHFLSVDPVTPFSAGGAFNRYWYASANPYGLVDPDGREPGDPPNNRSPGPIDCRECDRRPPPPPPPPKRPCSDACMRLRYTSAHGGSKTQAMEAVSKPPGSVPTGSGWFRPDGHMYVVGRQGNPLVHPGGGVGRFIDDHVPAGHTFGTNHDALVDKLENDWHWPDSIANIPSMPFAYMYSYQQEAMNTDIRIVNYLFGSNLPEYTHEHSGE